MDCNWHEKTDPKSIICQEMYIHARRIGKNAKDPYNAELFATPICAIMQTLSHSPNASAITAPDKSAQRVSTLQYGMNL